LDTWTLGHLDNPSKNDPTTGVFRIQGQLLRAAEDAASQVTVEWI
jgi:hypothetical protein